MSSRNVQKNSPFTKYLKKKNRKSIYHHSLGLLLIGSSSKTSIFTSSVEEDTFEVMLASTGTFFFRTRNTPDSRWCVYGNWSNAAARWMEWVPFSFSTSLAKVTGLHEMYIMRGKRANNAHVPSSKPDLKQTIQNSIC